MVLRENKTNYFTRETEAEGRRAGNSCAIGSRLGYIWIWSGARDQESTNHSAYFVEGKCSYVTKHVISVFFFVVLLYYCRHSCQSRKEYYHFLGEKTKGKNTNCKSKPAELTTLVKINWVIVMNANLLSNRKPKQQVETFSLPGWKTSISKKC